jgi:hypothetical protein
MILGNFARAGTALAAAALLFATATAGAGATDTFNVSTTIDAACSVTDAGPSDLTPTYAPSTDTGTGSATTLNTFCSGTTPSVTFTDAFDSFFYIFAMTSGGGTNFLYYQISNNTSCTGVGSDNPINENSAISLAPGNNTFNICAAVIAGNGTNTSAVAGVYTDTVTYSIAP